MTIKEVSEKYGISGDTLRYYEKIGMIPPVTRTPGGIRNYTETDLSWIELVLCMRNAGLPIEAIIEYVRLYRMGDSTFAARLSLLRNQRTALIAQKERIDEMLSRLNYKIARYEVAVETGELTFNKQNTLKPHERKGEKAMKKINEKIKKALSFLLILTMAMTSVGVSTFSAFADSEDGTGTTELNLDTDAENTASDDTVDLAFQTDGHGKFLINGEDKTNQTITVNKGTEVTYEVTADDGYQIQKIRTSYADGTETEVESKESDLTQNVVA